MTETLLRTALPVLAAVLAALAVDLLAARRGEAAPGFRPPAPAAGARRLVATILLAFVFYVGIFLSFTFSEVPDLDLSTVAPWQLFTLHALLGSTLLAWAVLALGPGARSGALRPPEASSTPQWPATGGTPAAAAPSADDARAGPAPAVPEAPVSAAAPGFLRRLLRAFRLEEDKPWREIGIGLLAGVAIWAVVILLVGLVAAALLALGRDEWLPQGPPELVAFIAAQPFLVRLLGSLSAGFFEETFFRGFLQPRVGIPLSTLLFALAHWSYGEPFMLVGVTLLSLTYAGLARWRGSVWAAITAHAVFDGVQLLILLPLALKAADSGLAPTVGSLAAPLLAALGMAS